MLNREQIAERLAAYEWTHQDGLVFPLRRRKDKEYEALETADELCTLLREFITPPLAYSKKQDAVAKARMLLEEWKEVER